MSSKLKRRMLMFYRFKNGMWLGAPRLTNLSNLTAGVSGLPVVGEIKVNVNATTPFSRGKVHKGILCCENSQVDDGDLFHDRYDDKYYFVMSKKGMLYNGETVYVDATMYMADSDFDIYRFEGGPSGKDIFGRPLQTSPVRITVNGTVKGMTNPQNYDIIQQKDRIVPQNKIEICLHKDSGVKVADRLVSLRNNNQYIVQTIDDTSLLNLVLCGVDTDTR